MIEKLLVQNFQKHGRLRVDFDPRITTIIGNTDAGKSAVLRAIKWVCLNYPRGDGFVRIGSDGCTVQLFVDDRKIVRRVGKGDNSYRLDDEEFKAFGANVPDPIEKVLNVGEGNFQGQHDPVFWFSDTSGEVSRRLNAVVDLGIIDQALAGIGQGVKKRQSELSVSKDRLIGIRQQKEKFDWVIGANEEYTEVERLAMELAAVTGRRTSLADRVSKAKESEKTRRRAAVQSEELNCIGRAAVEANNATRRRESLSKVLGVLQLQSEILKRPIPDVSYLGGLMGEWETSVNRLTHLRGRLVDVRRQKVIVASAPPSMDFVVKSYDVCIAARDKRMKLQTNIGHLLAGKKTVDYLRSAQGEAEFELHKELDGVCPVCGGEYV